MAGTTFSCLFVMVLSEQFARRTEHSVVYECLGPSLDVVDHGGFGRGGILVFVRTLLSGVRNDLFVFCFDSSVQSLSPLTPRFVSLELAYKITRFRTYISYITQKTPDGNRI